MTAVLPEIQYLRYHLNHGSEPDEGILFFKALLQCRLDGTPASIARLDKLFAQLVQKGFDFSALLQKQGSHNFFLTVAIYLIDYIGEQIDQTAVWRTHADLVSYLDQPDAPKTFATSLGASFYPLTCLPLDAILKNLNAEQSFARYIASTQDRILQNARVDLYDSASNIANHYLKKVRTGTLIDQTIGFHDRLKQIKFDYSYDSIDAIDAMLTALKAEYQFTPEDYHSFINQLDNREFLMLLGCYVGATAGRLARTAFKWLNYEEMQSLFKETLNFEFRLEHNQVMTFSDGHMRTPILPITNYLFDITDSYHKRCRDYIEVVVDVQAGSLTSFGLEVSSPLQLTEDWHTVATLAGNLAAFNIDRIHTGVHASPMRMERDTASQKTNVIDYSFQSEDIVSQLLAKIDAPTTDQPFGLLSYEMYANLPTGRTDGICIEVRTYREPRLNLQFILPYRHASNPLGFAVFPLVNHQVKQMPIPQLEALAQAFYRGCHPLIASEQDTDFWQLYYISQHDIYQPSPIVNDPPRSYLQSDHDGIVLFEHCLETAVTDKISLIDPDVVATAILNQQRDHSAGQSSFEPNSSRPMSSSQSVHSATTAPFKNNSRTDSKGSKTWLKVVLGASAIIAVLYMAWLFMFADSDDAVDTPLEPALASVNIEPVPPPSDNDTQYATSPADAYVDVIDQMLAAIKTKLPYTFTMAGNAQLKSIEQVNNQVTLDIYLKQEAVLSNQATTELFCLDALLYPLTKVDTGVTLAFYRNSGEYWYTTEMHTTDCD